jgi:Predicted pPIWI-associating nuclease
VAFWSTALRSLELEVRSKLIDDFSAQVLTGALAVVTDPSNPIRLNLFAAAMRELFGHALHVLAPDANVTKCEWYKPEPRTNGPTRRQRAKYATQDGLPDDYIDQIGVNVTTFMRPRSLIGVKNPLPVRPAVTARKHGPLRGPAGRQIRDFSRATPSLRFRRHSLIPIDVLFSSCLPLSSIGKLSSSSMPSPRETSEFEPHCSPTAKVPVAL